MDPHHWTRRRFLAAGSVLAVAATLPVATLWRAGRRHKADQLGYRELLPLEGERIRMVGDAGTQLDASVVAVTDRTTTSRGVRLIQTSMVLRTSATGTLPDQNFRIEHPEWGSCELFCAQIHSRSQSVHYEAVLSRLEGRAPQPA